MKALDAAAVFGSTAVAWDHQRALADAVTPDVEHGELLVQRLAELEEDLVESIAQALIAGEAGEWLDSAHRRVLAQELADMAHRIEASVRTIEDEAATVAALAAGLERAGVVAVGSLTQRAVGIDEMSVRLSPIRTLAYALLAQSKRVGVER